MRRIVLLVGVVALALSVTGPAFSTWGGEMARLRRRGSRAAIFASLLMGGVLICTTAPAALAGTTVSTTTPFSFSGTNPCTGDTFTGSGQLHFLMSDNLSPSGMVQHHLEASFSGLQAVTIAPVAGKKYVAVYVEDLTQTFDFDGAPAHETFNVTAQFVRSGEDGSLITDDDFYEHFFAHITANANGTVTVQDVTFESTCK
jgi:hypothetical protein